MTMTPKLSSEATLPRWLVKTLTDDPFPTSSCTACVHARTPSIGRWRGCDPPSVRIAP